MLKKLVSLLLSFILILGTFGDMTQAATGKSSPVTLRFLAAYSDYDNSFQGARIVERYKSTHPGVNLVVEYRMSSSIDDDLKKYDVLFMPSADSTIIYANTDKLVPLNDLAATKNNLYAQYLPINGNIYGIPATTNFEVVFYRKSIFREYKLSIPQTWDEFIKDAQIIKNGKKYIPIALSSKNYWSCEMLGKSMPSLIAGKSLWYDMLNDNSPFSKGKPYYTALTRIKQLSDLSLVSGDNSQASLTASETLFTSKKAAMLLWKEYMKQHFDTSPGSDIGCFFLPVRDKITDTFNITANIDSYLIVSKSSTYQKEAKEFVDWFFTSPFYPSFLSDRGYTATVKGVQKTQFPVVQDALKSAGANYKFITATITNATFDKRMSRSGIYSFAIAADIFAGRGIDDLSAALNQQWSSTVPGGMMPVMPVGSYAQSVANNKAYTPPAVNYNYQGPGLKTKKDVNSAIDASVILNTDYSYAYAYSVKTRMDSSNSTLKSVVKNGCMMVPISFLRDGLGATIEYANTSLIKVNYNTNNAVLSLNKNSMTVGNKTVNLDTAPQMINGALYVPLNGLVENVFNLKILTQQNTGIIYYDDMAPDNGEASSYFSRADLIFKNDGLLRITVDPRVELLKVMELLGGINTGRVSSYDSAYRREVINYFSPYMNHPSVQLLKSLGSGATVSLLSTLMAYSAPPSLTLEAVFSNDSGSSPGGTETCIEAMRQFAKDTNFMNFYEKNYCIFRSFIQDAQNQADKGNYMSKLTDYYGSKLNSYNTILAPLLVMVSCGPHMTWETGKVDTYNIITSLQPQNDIPWFGTPDRLLGIIWHEYGHSYVNSLTDSYWDQLKDYSKLVSTGMPSIYGNDWQICVNEHIVRAITARLILSYSGQQAYKNEIESQKQQGFIYIEDVCKLLADYENNRSKYPQLKDFYSKIVELFKAKYQQISSIDYGPVYCFIYSVYSDYVAA